MFLPVLVYAVKQMIVLILYVFIVKVSSYNDRVVLGLPQLLLKAAVYSEKVMNRCRLTTDA